MVASETDERPTVHQLFYQHPDTWFGDCMPVYAEGAFQLFHQRDTRRPGPFGEPFGWALARTTDFVHYEDLGEVIERGADDAQDQFVFAGSVFADRSRYHALYTGFNRDYPAQGKAAQVLLHAVSGDLRHWEPVAGELVPPQPGYDPDNWRDPYVLRDDEHGRWVMILGARLDGDPIQTSGRTVWFTSEDLETWAFQGDFWAPDRYTMHEMPDLFWAAGRWYLLTTEYSDRSKTVYRSSPTLQGPWTAPVDDAFDGRAYYAARSASDGEHRYLFGWVATKEGDRDVGGWQWGGTLVVHEVLPRADGSLAVAVPGTVRAAFGAATELVGAPVSALAPDGRRVTALGDLLGDAPTLLSLRLVVGAARSVAIRLFCDGQGDGYAFTFRIGERRLDFDRVPNYPWFRYDNRGLERPFLMESHRPYDVDVIIDDTIATVYVDGVALSARMYERPGSGLAVEVVDGELTVERASIARLEAQR